MGVVQRIAGKGKRLSRLHRDSYYNLCARELKDRDGLADYPGDGPFWRECHDMTEAVYGADDYLRPPENNIAADTSLTHADKLRRIEALRDERERQQRAKEARRKATDAAEQHHNRERIGAMLTDMMAECVAEYAEAVNDAPAPEPVMVCTPLAGREFDDFLTTDGRTIAAKWGIIL